MNALGRHETRRGAVINAVAAVAASAIDLDLIGLRATRVRVDGDRRTAFRPSAAR